ncbi:neural proliferation differentiation and control protein 1-like isoform X2 [Scyliorhinus canicula]|uniref:neural proliferation differentiation and control protein 1-like isoform X2 n=1 Tax=Scyliorhinus canicula TaxID=7830 RepID=UPI0018F6A02B|nr:neural proliferation differentiation and control protein 1-like isoform X2 [Scyliorhinus canicula]
MASAREYLSWCSFSARLCLIISLAISDSASQCPRRLDCTLRRRHPCPSGSADCGRCLPHYREDQERKCVLAGQPPQLGGSAKADGTDDAIGLIHSLLAHWEKFTPATGTDHETSRTASELRLAPSNARGNDTDRSKLGPSHSTGIPGTTAKTTAESHSGPDRGRKRSSLLLNDVVSLSLVIICIVTGLFGLVVAGLCWYRLQKEVRRTQKMSYEGNQQAQPQPLDWKIVGKLHRHHYQHQKNVLQAMEEAERWRFTTHCSTTRSSEAAGPARRTSTSHRPAPQHG